MLDTAITSVWYRGELATEDSVMIFEVTHHFVVVVYCKMVVCLLHTQDRGVLKLDGRTN